MTAPCSHGRCACIERIEQLQANEKLAFERLSLALTGGSASTWDELFHAVDTYREQLEAGHDARCCCQIHPPWCVECPIHGTVPSESEP